ncbi:MAG: hypothetical protein MIN69_02595 [Methylorubrum extorquens]|jgi:hypothetical protein|uniref:Uncharacterized protein n=1 Tax=Methylorubrum extorquens DSM 13060 TaxID=882800 RepID=H1KFR1_METEX|nr:hypothetical protein [Methylorubrum extorquens]EHP93642.1 hypothetical protein MetexDRAFT_1473 [Methylorubrum extorquens DSM 13060]MCG5244344.1 hypothetical protein [Methylorubrum extorquens]
MTDVVELKRSRAASSSTISMPGSVARIVQDLVGGRRESHGDASPATPLQIRLDELVGLGDRTVARLAALAGRRTLTPESAARLALRHAREINGATPRRQPASGGEVGHQALEFTLAGDPFGLFAFRLQGARTWIGFAQVACIDLLLEVCPAHRGPVCLLLGHDAERRTVVSFVKARDWHCRLSGMVLDHRRRACQHILVLGGLPPRGSIRSSILSDLEQAVRRGGNSALLAAPGRRARTVRDERAVMLARDLLKMIELTFPGLVEVDRTSGEMQS